MDQVKVGEETFAYCTSCKEMRLHVVVAMVGPKPARVECRSCHKQHNYKADPPGTAKKKTTNGGTTATSAPKKAKAKSEPEKASGQHPLDALLQVRNASEARVYSPADRYAVGDLLSHPTFGLGAVSAIPAPGKIEVVFRDSQKLLMHERPAPGASASQQKLQPPPKRDDSRAPVGASDAPPRR